MQATDASKNETLTGTAKMTTLETLARKMMLTAAQAIALPQVVTSAAKGQGMSEQDLIAACFANDSVMQYLAGICRKVMA
jgi:hypothetical protein